ncbi:heat shock protein 23-like [Bradysia coprophila]|uniref:heat shock protein 23-like n=1 Tax=Bradysia coprophila TaxID=38358 RepID=UPI00187DD4A2|nr:heat shock protein 23-like [Bradysia coprophila]
MALLPLLIELNDELSQPSFRHWNNFGPGLYSHELDSLPSLLNQYYTGYQRCPRFQAALRNSTDSADVPKSSIGKDGFQVCMDVQEFAPNEISVKTIDNAIVVEAKHEERRDEHGYISRQFKRRYALPKGFNIKDVVTQLSSDGILTVKAPPEVKVVDEGNVRVLQIQQTGPARLNSGNKESVKSKEDEMVKEQKKDAQQ